MWNILILDDNKDILDALVSSLCHCLKDCNILTGSNGQQGEQILKSVPIDLVLTDLDMPVMNGYTFIEQCRKEFPGVRLCAMTGPCTPDVERRLANLGVRRYIEKPFHFDVLADMLKAELAASSGGRSAARQSHD